jgi:hypothetical protein
VLAPPVLAPDEPPELPEEPVPEELPEVSEGWAGSEG